MRIAFYNVLRDSTSIVEILQQGVVTSVIIVLYYVIKILHINTFS